MTSTLSDLVDLWRTHKANETSAQEQRRAVEDQIAVLLNVSPALDGVQNTPLGDGSTVLKVTGRIDRKVDAERLQEIAREHGLEDHLSSLFRWVPTVNASVWKAAAPEITRPLLDAITSKPGRPSFSIKDKDK